MSTAVFEEHEVAVVVDEEGAGTAMAEGQSANQPPEPGRRPDGWPEPLEDAARYGLAGDVVGAIDPHTEGDPAAILLQLLVAVGNVVGRNPHFRVEASQHYLNLFLALVGETSKARKGTSWGHVAQLFTLLECQAGKPVPVPWNKRVVSGLSSGEGLICEVRDPGQGANDFHNAGMNDKRRIVIDGEFASTLKVLGRQGNTLSPVLRNAWDSGELRIMTKNSPAEASGAHISIIGHITRDELRRELNATEMGNGFANRFLWGCVRRSKILPDGGNLGETELGPLVARLADVLGSAENLGEIKRDGPARERWCEVYPELSEGKPGMLGAVTARAEAQVVRLSSLYAVLDESPLVRVEHLEAALAVWRYCEASARFIFGDATGDPVADKIIDAVRGAGRSGLSRTGIRNLFQHNQSKDRIDEALNLLRETDRAETRTRGSGRQRTEMWLVREER